VTRYLPHRVRVGRDVDGTLHLRSEHPLGPVAEKTGIWLHHWAEAAPERVFLAERQGAGWYTLGYAEVLDKVQGIASALLQRGLTADTPILVLSGNSVRHGLLALAAQYVGVPLVPLTEQYALIPEARGRVSEVARDVKPALVYAEDLERFGAALELVKAERVSAADLDLMCATPVSGALEVAYGQVGPKTLAKILMTSGSNSRPKGVLTTQEMMCVNQAQLRGALPFLGDAPPCIVDWLPWSHVFGGSHNFNLMLANGGSLYIDDGKPVQGRFERTLENLAMVQPSLMFNVPVGYGMLLAALEKDSALAAHVFGRLDMLFYAGAVLPQDIWQGLERVARAAGSTPLMTTSWGMTETAPCCILPHEPGGQAGGLGVPVSGVDVKLCPLEEGRYELRVKGSSIFKGYHGAPEKTAEAFDGEGYLRTEDAVSFVDPEDANKGLRFEGRLSEEFKLSSGTWVRVAELREALLDWLQPLALDLVIVGEGQEQIGVMLVPDREVFVANGMSLDEAGDMMICARALAALRERLTDWNAAHSGASRRVGAALFLAEPPQLGAGEVTAKGNLNSRKITGRRMELVGRLCEGGAGVLML
jgi:feruloyl-CoA synthase